MSIKSVGIMVVFIALFGVGGYFLMSRENVDYTEEIRSAGVEYFKQKYGTCGGSPETTVSAFNIKQYGMGRASIVVDCNSGPEGGRVCPLDLRKDEYDRWSVIDKEYECAVS